MHSSLEGVHKSIYHYLKNKALALEGKPSVQLSRYRKDQQQASTRDFSDSTLEELSEALELSDIIYLGDFHTFDQSTRNLERLIRIVSDKEHQFSIGLEFVHVNHQKYINHFISGHITELEFLESIRYKESWRFPWTFYKKFFELAKDRDIPIIALNSQGTLTARDKNSANVIAKYHKENSDRKLLILFGEYHIVSNKLPQKVFEATNKTVIQTIIHQNLDQVYWKLSSDKKLRSDVIVKFDQREFVLISSAPWLKYESQIYWYEHLSEDPEFDIHEYIIEKGAINFSENVPDNFAYICEEFIKTFRIDVKVSEIDDFHLFDHIKLAQVQQKIIKNTPPRIQNFYTSLIKRSRSFKLPQTSEYFCPSYSINRLSYLAGIHIHHLKLSSQLFDSSELLKSRKRDQIFVYFLYQSMSGYLASKSINPYRKCNLYLDYKKAIRLKKIKESKRDLYKIALKLTDEQKAISEQIKGIHLLGIYNLSRILGHMYAELLFNHFFVLEQNEFKEVLNIIYSNDFSQDSFLRLRKKVLQNIDYKKLSKRLF